MAKRIASLLCALAMLVTMVSLVATFTASATDPTFPDFEGHYTVKNTGGYANVCTAATTTNAGNMIDMFSWGTASDVLVELGTYNIGSFVTNVSLAGKYSSSVTSCPIYTFTYGSLVVTITMTTDGDSPAANVFWIITATYNGDPVTLSDGTESKTSFTTTTANYTYLLGTADNNTTTPVTRNKAFLQDACKEIDTRDGGDGSANGGSAKHRWMGGSYVPTKQIDFEISLENGVLTIAALNAAHDASTLELTADLGASALPSAVCTVEMQRSNAQQTFLFNYTTSYTEASAASVTADFQDGSTPVALVLQDGKLPTLPVPTRARYQFDGWFDDATDGSQVHAGDAANDGDTIYAHWTLLPVFGIFSAGEYNVSRMGNGEAMNGEAQNQCVVHDTTYGYGDIMLLAGNASATREITITDKQSYDLSGGFTASYSAFYLHNTEKDTKMTVQIGQLAIVIDKSPDHETGSADIYVQYDGADLPNCSAQTVTFQVGSAANQADMGAFLGTLQTSVYNQGTTMNNKRWVDVTVTYLPTGALTVVFADASNDNVHTFSTTISNPDFTDVQVSLDTEIALSSGLSAIFDFNGTYTPATPAVLTPAGASLTIDSSEDKNTAINVVYRKSDVDAQGTGFTATATLNGVAYTDLPLVETTIDTIPVYVATLDKVTPNLFGTKATFTLTNDTVTGDAFEYSVKDYCANKISSTTASDELKAVCANLLVYGEAVRVYLGDAAGNPTTSITDGVDVSAAVTVHADGADISASGAAAPAETTDKAFATGYNMVANGSAYAGASTKNVLDGTSQGFDYVVMWSRYPAALTANDAKTYDLGTKWSATFKVFFRQEAFNKSMAEVKIGKLAIDVTRLGDYACTDIDTANVAVIAKYDGTEIAGCNSGMIGANRTLLADIQALKALDDATSNGISVTTPNDAETAPLRRAVVVNVAYDNGALTVTVNTNNGDGTYNNQIADMSGAITGADFSAAAVSVELSTVSDGNDWNKEIFVSNFSLTSTPAAPAPASFTSASVNMRDNVSLVVGMDAANAIAGNELICQPTSGGTGDTYVLTSTAATVSGSVATYVIPVGITNAYTVYDVYMVNGGDTISKVYSLSIAGLCTYIEKDVADVYSAEDEALAASILNLATAIAAL